MVAFQGCGIFFPWGMTLGENPKMRLSNSNCIGVERAVSTRCFLLVWLCNGCAMCELLLFIAHRHAFQKANQPFTLERRTSCNSSFFSPNKFARDVIYILLLCERAREILCRVMLEQMCESLKCQKLLAPFKKMTFLPAFAEAQMTDVKEGNRQLSLTG